RGRERGNNLAGERRVARPPADRRPARGHARLPPVELPGRRCAQPDYPGFARIGYDCRESFEHEEQAAVMIGEHPIQDFLAIAVRRVVALVFGSALVVVIPLIRVLLAFIGPIYTPGVLIAVAGGVWMFSAVRNEMLSFVLIIALLPYATLPFELIL